MPSKSSFAQGILSPYLNFHRPCSFPTEAIDADGGLRDLWIRPGADDSDLQDEVLGEPLRREARAPDLLAGPKVAYGDLMRLAGVGPGVTDPAVAEQLEIQGKYAGCIDR